jgi:hypothetical protein
MQRAFNVSCGDNVSSAIRTPGIVIQGQPLPDAFGMKDMLTGICG